MRSSYIIIIATHSRQPCYDYHPDHYTAHPTPRPHNNRIPSISKLILTAAYIYHQVVALPYFSIFVVPEISGDSHLEHIWRELQIHNDVVEAHVIGLLVLDEVVLGVDQLPDRRL